MTSVTFHFDPLDAGAGKGPTINQDKPQYLDRNKKKIIEAGRGEIQLGPHNIIRYTEEPDSLSEECLVSVYNRACEQVKGHLDDLEDEYRVCMILSGEDPAPVYVNSEDEIEKFALNNFGSVNISSRNLGKERIKISLPSEGNRIKV